MKTLQYTIFETALKKRPLMGLTGEIAVELELEGNDGNYFLPEGWLAKHEPSLGPTGVEFVMTQPVKIREFPELVYQLFNVVTGKSGKLRTTNNGGTHFHINVLKYTVEEVYKIFAAFWIFESLLVKVNGDYREGNLFCLRAGDAEQIVYDLIKTVSSNFFWSLKKNQDRYSALNPESITKFGSIEFRFICGLINPNDIVQWGLGLHHFSKKAASCDLQELLDTVGVCFGDSQDKLLFDWFGPLAEKLLAVAYKERANILMDGWCYTYRMNLALKNQKQKQGYKFNMPEHEDYQNFVSENEDDKNPELEVEEEHKVLLPERILQIPF